MQKPSRLVSGRWISPLIPHPGNDATLAGVNDSANETSYEERIKSYIERAIKRCGTAAALARLLEVSSPTVSQWRKGLKKPDAINLMRIQDLAGNAI